MRSTTLTLILGSSLLLAACASNPAPDSESGEYEIVTLLPKDAIPSIDSPRFYNISEADAEYAPDEVVIGVEINGDARAYSVGMLSRHEIVNDEVGGRPIAVTW